MIRTPLNKQGFAHSHLILLVLVALLIFIIGQRVVRLHTKTPMTTVAANATPPSTTSTSDKQNYHDSLGSFQVEYPAGWQIKTDQSPQNGKPASLTTLTAPAGSIILTLNFNGGDVYSVCDPDIYHDVPFQVSNRCFSSEYLDAYPVGVSINSSNSVTISQVNLYLAHYHYKTSGINNTELYSSCLVAGQPTLHKPEMGFEPVHPHVEVISDAGVSKGFVTACVDAGSTSTGYTNAEVKLGEQILRSFRFDN